MTDHQRLGSEPFISGDDFRNLADFIFEEAHESLDPRAVSIGDIIFLGGEDPKGQGYPVGTIREKFFKEIHPLIDNPYILITHNSDLSFPGPYLKVLEDPKIFVWFTVNPDIKNHPKLKAIPIGLENMHWGRNYPKLIQALQLNPVRRRNSLKYLLYGNFNVATNVIERSYVFNHFYNKRFCYFPKRARPLQEFLQELQTFQFVLSPRGNGLDCHRTWEALLLGTIPIVKTSMLDPLYSDLPVIIVNEWENITTHFLRYHCQEMKLKNYSLHKIYFDYWRKLILDFKKKCIEGGFSSES